MTTTVPSNITQFNLAQTFYVDPSSVKSSPQVSITGIGVYFSAKPARTGNKSGITAPGVNLFLCATQMNGTDEVPDTGAMVHGGYARVEYDNINTSSDASSQTRFTFPFPINVTTGRTYAIVIKYDGDEQFVIWKSVEGDHLVGTINQTAGPAGKYIGKYYDYSYVSALGGASSNTSLSTSTNTSGNWKPLNTTDLKFSVYVAQFIPDTFANTTITDPSSGNTSTVVLAETSYMLYKKPYEFVVYDFLNSTNWANLIAGETIYQNNVIRPEVLTVISGNNLVTGRSVNFSTIFGNGSNDKYIVLYSGTFKNVRKITSVVSNTSILLDIPPTFSNAAAQFSKVVGGKIDMATRNMAFGKLENTIAIDQSSANSTLRFVNNTIETISITSGGTGYSNSDYLVIYNGGIANAAVEANAVANLVTNSTGGITSLTMTNKGVGFMITPSYAVKVANGSANSSGSGASLTFTVGATLMTEFSNASLGSVRVINMPINTTVIGAVDVENPYGTSYYFKNHYLYYSKADGVGKITVNSGGTGYANTDTITFTGGSGSGAFATLTTDSIGRIVYANVKSAGVGYTSIPTAVIATSGGTGAALTPSITVSRYTINSGLNDSIINMLERKELSYANTPLILSRSNEVMQPNTAITTVTGTTINTNISSVIEMVVTSNNVYVAADILSAEVDAFIEKYAINNDYTNENTGTGAATSKHISFVQSFANNYLAEDMLVYMDVYRPANTDIKVYAKILNSKDPSPFVNKDWTLLQNRQNANSYSSPIDDTDLLEFTWGFNPYPNTALTLTGTATTTSNSNVITGANSTYNTQLVAGDIVKIYSPLFANNYMVASVNAVTNSSSIIIDNFVTNNNVIGAGLVLDKIAYKNQAFNNSLNNNIVRYYDANNAIYDGYNSFAIKIVFLSDNEFVVPKVENIRVVGVTA